jgi:hypothetical protein
VKGPAAYILGWVLLLAVGAAPSFAQVEVCAWKGTSLSHVTASEDVAAGWQVTACAEPCDVVWTGCIGSLSGLRALALVVDGAGAVLRWNDLAAPEAGVLLFSGGGGTTWPAPQRDLAGDETDWADLQGRGYEVWEAKWRKTGILYRGEAGRFVRSSADPQGLLFASTRVAHLVEWWAGLPGALTPRLALAGSSGGGDAALGPLLARAAVQDRLGLVLYVSGMPNADLPPACSGLTPDGTWVDEDTGALGSSGVGNPSQYGGGSNAEGYVQGLWRSSECTEKSIVQGAPHDLDSSSVDLLDPGSHWLGRLVSIVGTGAGNPDGPIGVVWSAGQIHAAVAAPSKRWYRCTACGHGCALTDQSSPCFDVVHGELVALLAAPTPTPTPTPEPCPPDCCPCGATVWDPQVHAPSVPSWWRPSP